MKCGPWAKNRTASATSSGSRCAASASFGEMFVGGIDFAIHNHAGATQLTLISGAKALAIVWVSICSAAFEVQ